MNETKTGRIPICGESVTIIGEAGRTGDWRTARPVVDNQRCIPAKRGQASCFLCWLYCPEAVITRTIPVQIDLEHCKGCGVCAEECPAQAISLMEEAGFRSSPHERERLVMGSPEGPCPSGGGTGGVPQI